MRQTKRFLRTRAGRALYFTWGILWFYVLTLAARCLSVKHVQLYSLEAPKGKRLQLIICGNMPMEAKQMLEGNAQSSSMSAWE